MDINKFSFYFWSGAIIFISLVILIFSRCTYTSYCKYCGTEFDSDLYVATEPNIHDFKFCPKCGKPINIGVYNNLENFKGNEHKDLIK